MAQDVVIVNSGKLEAAPGSNWRKTIYRCLCQLLDENLLYVIFVHEFGAFTDRYPSK